MLSFADYRLNANRVLPGGTNSHSRVDEISTSTFDLIADKMDKVHFNPDEMPLNNVFRGKTRIAIPLGTGEIESLTTALKDSGVSPNYATGIAVRTVKTERGTKEQPLKIGKAIEYLAKSKSIPGKWVDYWNKNGGNVMKQVRENPKFAGSIDPEYTIVISRSPIDLLRMSDFENITSCHSQGSDYFKCAIQEAVNGGAIAYLVKTDALRGANLEAREIFADSERKVAGIKPLSRLRIRLYESDKMQLGVPEMRTYGENFPGFQEAVKKFLLGQQELDSRPKMKDFQLLGGSYRDSNDSHLFNSFFGDSEDSGNANWKPDDEENERIAGEEQLRIQIRNIDRNNNKFENPVSAYYQEDDDRDDEEPLRFYWGGTLTCEFPARYWNVEAAEKIKTYELARIVNTKCEYDVDFEDVHIDDDSATRTSSTQKNWAPSGNVKLEFSIRDDNCPGEADGYSDFLTKMEIDYDDNYREIYETVKTVLTKLSILMPLPQDRIASLVDQYKFAHFRAGKGEKGSPSKKSVVSEAVPILDFSELNRLFPGWNDANPQLPYHSFASVPYDSRQAHWKNASREQKFKEVQKVAVQKIRQWWDAAKNGHDQQPALPGMNKPRMRDLSAKMAEPELKFDTSDASSHPNNGKIFVDISFPFEIGMTGEQAASTLRGIRFIDQNYGRFVNDIRVAVIEIFGREYEKNRESNWKPSHPVLHGQESNGTNPYIPGKK